MHWPHYWGSLPCSYPDRTGDLRSIVKIYGLLLGWQWHSTGMASDIYRPTGMEHELQLCLPEAPGRTTGRAGPCG